MKVKITIVLWLSVCLIILSTQSSTESMTPILEFLGQKSDVEYNREFVISWYIIDDDPASYKIQRNNTNLESGRIDSTVITISRIEPLGFWNFTIIVLDYTGNQVNQTITIKVVELPTTAASSTATDTASPTFSDTFTSQAAGFNFNFIFIVLFSLTVILINRRIKMRKIE